MVVIIRENSQLAEYRASCLFFLAEYLSEGLPFGGLALLHTDYGVVPLKKAILPINASR